MRDATPPVLVETLLVLRHRDRATELRVELQQPATGPMIVSLRVWDRGADLPTRSGFSLRADEIAPVAAALVRALDLFRADERTRRLDLYHDRDRDRRSGEFSRPRRGGMR